MGWGSEGMGWDGDWRGWDGERDGMGKGMGCDGDGDGDGKHPAQAALPVPLPVQPGVHPAPAGQPPAPPLHPHSLPDSRTSQGQPAGAGHRPHPSDPHPAGRSPPEDGARGAQGHPGGCPARPQTLGSPPVRLPPARGCPAPQPARPDAGAGARRGPAPGSLLPAGAGSGIARCVVPSSGTAAPTGCGRAPPALRRGPCTAALHRSHALQLSTIPLHDSPAPQPSSRAVRRSCASYPRTAAMQRQLRVAGHAPPDERRAARAGLSHLPDRAAKARRVTPGAAASHDPIRCSVQSCPSAGTRCSAQGPVGFCPLRTITVPCQVGSRLQAAQGTAAGSVCRGA